MKKSQNNISREFQASRYIATFAIATLLFIFGVLIGYAITSSKLNNLQDIEETLRVEMLDFNLQAELAEDYPCSSYSLQDLGERLGELGTKITMLENQLGKNHNTVIELKKPYTLLNVRHYLLIKNRIEKCRENYTAVLFFYSNKPEYVSESEKQGYVLDYLTGEYDEQIKVYAIDSDLNLGIVNALKEIYNVNNYPTVVMNDRLYVGFHSKEEFENNLAL